MPLQQKYARTIQIGVTLGVVILLMTTVLRSQQTPPVGPVWEYVSISAFGNGPKVTICYASNSGCRNESGDGVMTTVAKLGEKGWELAATNDENTVRTMYFKRLRSVIHRGD